ncbi:MAG TPA: hypothetical protein VNL35_05220 [Chloroflexota bacterium]|nr:hypothetical protein [Chloroflexota bacterium]
MKGRIVRPLLSRYYLDPPAAGVDAAEAGAAGVAVGVDADPSALLLAAVASPPDPLAAGFGSPLEPFPSAFRSPAGTLPCGVLRESVL